MKASAISWCDYSGGDLNFVSGCTGISPGCQHCYARAIYERFGRDFSKVVQDEDKLGRLRKKHFPPPYKRGGERPLCFTCDTGDLFHDSVRLGVISSFHSVALQRHDVDWLVLTKRPLNACWYMASISERSLPPNLWLGVSAENQAWADERMALLGTIPAVVRVVSMEPLLGPIDATRWLRSRKFHWVIVGGESGPSRHPFDVQWALDLYRQCQEAHVPMFYKQGSGLRPGMDAELPGIGKVQEWPERARQAPGRE